MNQYEKSGRWASGMSTTEVVGVLVALTLGVAAGFALRILPAGSSDDAPPVAEAPPVQSQSVPAPHTDAAPVDASELIAEEMQQFKQELLSELREQVANSEATRPAAPRQQTYSPAAAHSESARRLHAQRGQRTLDYWNQLNDVMLREEQMRSVPLGGLTASNARDFLRRRGKAGKFAADEIRKLSTEGVDVEVIGIAADIAAWYDHGNQLNGTASFLMNQADASERRGQPGQQWQDGEKQHSASVADINRRGDEIRRRMIEKYGLPFPDMR